MAQVKVFEDQGIGAMVHLATQEGSSEEALEIGEKGVLEIPSGVKPTGFHLVLLVPQETRIVITQKNVGKILGGYHRHTLAQMNSSLSGFTEWVMHDPIDVMRVGGNVWTRWHEAKPNRIDCCILSKEGETDVFLVGVITHDNGITFRLLGESRWRGHLFTDEKQGIVAKTSDSKWGPFPETRRGIFEEEEFQKLLADTTLSSWVGTPEELNPPLDPMPGPGYARILWYSPFGGQTGQGIAKLHDDSSAWIHGVDIVDPPDKDGIKRLWYNDLVAYEGEPQKWGTREGAPPKLLGVKRIRV